MMNNNNSNGVNWDETTWQEINDAVVAFEQRTGWTNLDAWRLLAMIAAHHAEMAAGVGKRAFLDVLDPGAEDAHRDLMLVLAGNRARMASDASVLVDHEAVTHTRVLCADLSTGLSANR